MSTLDLTAPPPVREVAAGRGIALAVATLFYAIGWVLMWLMPPVAVVAVRALGDLTRWCFAAARVGWVEARDGRPAGRVVAER